MENRIRRALVSVWDKTGVVEFAAGLAAQGIELLSTGGTATALRAAGLTVRDVADFTGFPEMFEGRVKTLHPKVHAGLLHRRDVPEDLETLAAHGLEPIDLVCVNLYPFEATVAQPGVTFAEAIEQIDIGGPTMLRSAAKNLAAVTVVCDPADYGAVLAAIAAGQGATAEPLRRRLAQKVFARLATYNAAIAEYLADQLAEPEQAARPLVIVGGPGQLLRYGENPHQTASLHLAPACAEASVAHAEVLHGKPMSHNNYLDGEAALESVKELAGSPGVSIVKHANPCGFATGATLAEAFEWAWAGDPVSSFGSVIAVTQPVDLATAQCLKGRFVEALIAPDFDPEARAWLTTHSKTLRLLKLRAPFGPPQPGRVLRALVGGWLLQDRDVITEESWHCPTSTLFPDEKKSLALFGVKVCRHLKSNAIALVRSPAPGQFQLLGMGAGQPNRVDAVRKLALPKARENLELQYQTGNGYGQSPVEFIARQLAECVLISDAFFPFPDNIEAAAEAGIRYVVQPGGSRRDEEVVAACDQFGIAMAFTGVRHFRH
ncbi:MAG: bifunctional phosphoribosylaminoimidazolecarboxamide formyltransferase/IMP cyclohydrolase [Candidatus Marinimicrobia bacterium]|nr:bifunctional phosphoribosylaminoimidazolecarboxamide formyltransferase/IMP cyclohydrolase [Candidatus Neomarinimicrobiota bacterium]